MKAKLITFVRGLKNGTPPRFQSYLKSLTLILTLLLSVNQVWADTKTDIMFAQGFGGYTSNSFSAAGTDRSAVANSTNATGVTYAMQVFNGSTGAVRGNQSTATSNFNCRNTTTKDGYYISQVQLTVSGGTIDGSTNNRSVVYFGSSAFTTSPSGTATTASPASSGQATLTWTNTDQTVSYFILYNLKTANVALSANASTALTVTWTQKSASTYTVLFEAGNNGSVDPTSIANLSGEQTITLNGNQLSLGGSTITATPSSGYQLQNWTIDDVVVTNNKTVSGACTIQANFEQIQTKRVYMKAGDWKNASPKFYAHSWGDHNHDVELVLVDCETDVYSAQIPADNTSILFTRQDGSSTSIEWNYSSNWSPTGKLWNKSCDITIGSYDLFTFSNWSSGEKDDNHDKSSFTRGTYTPISFTVSLDKNGGTGSVSDITNISCGGSATLTTNNLTKLGHNPHGWNTNASGTGTHYNDGATISDIRDDIELFAEWELASYTLTWDLDGGTAGTGTITPAGQVAYGTVLQYTVNPTKEGYNFNGWNPAMTSGTTTMPDHNQTYTAQWTPKPYTLTVASVGDVEITARPQGGSEIAEGSNANVDYNKTVTLNYSSLTAGKGLEWNVYKTGESGTKVTVSGSGNGATFTMPAYPVTVAATIASAPTWTITLNTGSGTLTSGTTSIVVVQGQSTTLPSCGIECEDDSYGEWQFAGWKSGSNVGTITTTEPDFVNTEYTPSGDITLYAVYKAVDASGGSESKYSQTTYNSGSDYWSGLGNYSNMAGKNVYFTIPENATQVTKIVITPDNQWGSGHNLAVDYDGTDKFIAYGASNTNPTSYTTAFAVTSGKQIHFTGTGGGTIKVKNFRVEWTETSSITRYWSIPCNEKYTMTFHGVGGDDATIVWGELDPDNYVELNATTITAYPTCTTAETDWTFLGWKTSNYNDDKTLDDENASTDDPDVNTIYKNGKGFALNSGTTEPCGDGVSCVDMFPVFTKFVENDKPEIATLASGSKYYMYYTSDAGGYQDAYSAIDHVTTRIYAYTFGSNAFNSTTQCSQAKLFEFTKRADGNWDIRMRNSDDSGYESHSYIYAGTSTDDTDLYSQATQPDHGWVIETVTINTKTMVKMRYAGNANTSRFMKVYDGGGSSASGTFKYYSEDCATSTQYHAIYLGSCSNRIFSSNPGHATTWEVYGNFTGSFMNYPMTNGMVAVQNLAANTTYQFKLRKTTDDGSTEFGAANQINTYDTSGEEWILDGTDGGHNVNLLTGVAGSYTFIASRMSAEFPGITVTYPTAYTITFDGNGNDDGSMTNVTNIAAGENVTLDANDYTKTGNHFNGWVADVDVKIGGATVTAGTLIADGATIQDINSNITLTAQWEVQTYTITYLNRNDAPFSGTNYDALPKTHTYGTPTTLVDAEPPTGYYFQGWYKDAECTVTSIVEIGATEITADITIYAKILPWGCDGYSFQYGGDDVKENNTSECFTYSGHDDISEIANFVIPNAKNYFVGLRGYFQNSGLGYSGAKSCIVEMQYLPFEATMSNDARPKIGSNAVGAIGTLRVCDHSNWDNIYVTFRPNGYGLMYGATGTENKIAFNQISATAWQTAPVELTADMKKTDDSFKYQVGLLKSNNDYIACGHSEAANFGSMGSYCSTWGNNGWGNNLSEYAAGRWGYFEIWIDNVNKNWCCHFTPMYRLHYDLAGGENANIHDEFRSYAQSGTALNTTVTTEVPVRDGYTFLGWQKDASPIEAGTTVAINADNIVITAQWAKNYTVTYDRGECAGPITHYCEETVTVCDAPEAVTGYTFGGWKTTNKINNDHGAGAILQPGTTFVMPCDKVVNVTFTAKLTANQYTINYLDQGGATFSGKHETGHPTKHTYNNETTLMGATKPGYEFGGWYKDASCEGAVVTTLGATEYTAEITLYAKWTANSYHATLDANGGTGEGGFNFTYGGTTVNNFTSTIARAGYDLNGFWSAASGGYQILNSNGTRTEGTYHSEWITADKGWVKANNDGVLYAHWTAKSGIAYRIEYYLMDLTGNYPATATEVDNHTGTAGQSASHTQKDYAGFDKPAKQGATIAGDGSTVIKYYYVRHQHAFAWEFNGGTPSGEYTPANPNMYYGAPITYPAIAKDGYAFMGWSPTDATMPDADLTITAQWGAYENYRTYCGDAVTFYAQNGTEPEETFVITTDNNKITTPTLAQTGFTRPEGWVLLGWIKVGGDTKIVEPGKANVAAADGDEYNAVWTHIAITGTVLTTSAVGVQVGTTIHVEGTTNNAYGLRVSFVDTKGTVDPSDDVTYGSATGQTAVAQSDFRLADTYYNYVDDRTIQIGGAAAGYTHSSDYNVVYTPKTANEIDNYELQIQVMQTSATALDGAVYTLNLKGRALPDNFVIAEYRDSKWYALPADMSGSDTYAGKEIMVEGTGMDRVVTNATLDMVYSMKTYNYDKSHVLFQSQFNQGHLWAATGTGTGINDNAKTISGKNEPYSWMPTPQNATLDTYVMSNANNNRTLAMYGTTFGMYDSYGTNIVYFIPLKVEEYTEKEMMMVEWFPTKVLIEVDEGALTDVRAKVNNAQVAGVTANDTKYGAHQYEITGLNTLVENAAKKLTILYTKNETTYGHEFDIPVIMSNKTYSISGGTTFPWTQAVYNTADLVVRDGSVLTVNGGTNAANTFGNVTIYPKSKVVVPEGKTMTTTTTTLFGGIDEIYNGSEYTLTKYIVPQLVLNGTLVHNETTSGLVYDVRVDKAKYYNFALPYTSMYELVTDHRGGYDYDYWVKVYNGQTRAETGNGWVYYDWSADPWALNIGTGYMLEAQSNVGQNYVILRHPLGYSNTGGKYAQNLDGHQSGTSEATKAAVKVYAHPSTYANNAGWNFIANPFMANFSKDLGDGSTGTIQTGKLVEHKVNEKWDGHYVWEEGSENVRYVTLYNNGTDTYTQLPMSDTVLAPFTGFFVQIAKEGTIVFDINGRVTEAPARMLSEDELPSEMEIFLHAACQGQKDDAVLFINDDLRRDNAKEFPNEMTKQENANMLNFYTFGGDDVKMYANGMSYEDAQGWSKAGVKVATAGEYTFSVTSDQAEYIQQVILRDMDSNTEYDLMSNDAKIYLDKGEMNDRFYVKIVFGKHNIGTGTGEMYNNRAPEKFILNDHMYIRANGVLYDGVGKRVKY